MLLIVRQHCFSLNIYSAGLMDQRVIVMLILLSASSNLWVGHAQSTYNVLDYGAKGDGQTDDSEAFLKAWDTACGATTGGTASTVLVPAGYSFILQPTKFKGPCKSNRLCFQILGTIMAPERTKWKPCISGTWLVFSDTDGLSFDGSGVIHGQGASWHRKNGSRLIGPCDDKLPSALRFEHCKGLQISRLKHMNGPGGHIHLYNATAANISNVTLRAPANSQNSDGIDLDRSSFITISESSISVGDDWVAIKAGCSFINVTQVACGSGHGISVGSLGRYGAEDKVEEVYVWNCSFNGATGAAKIKTWRGGKGYATAMSFKHLTIANTKYPIFIDQHYMHSPEQKQATKVINITFSDIHGTCADERAIFLDCAGIGCNHIILDQINITSIDPEKPASTTICNNTQGIAKATAPPVPCLSR